LCRFCNSTVGYAHESLETLKAMVRYVEEGERRAKKAG
jgi:hypothetical protein